VLPLLQAGGSANTLIHLLTFGDRLPRSGVETFLQSVGGFIQSTAGGFGSSIQHHPWISNGCIAACIIGTFVWNYCGGDASQLVGLGGEQRFKAMNEKQRQELDSPERRETTPWKRLSLGLFRRSGMQAIFGAVTGGAAWAVWALGSAYMGPGEEYVKAGSFVAMLLLSAAFGWSMSHTARMKLMGLDENDNVI
jgi:hypothetical protein